MTLEACKILVGILPDYICFNIMYHLIISLDWAVTVAYLYRLPLGTEQVVSSIPGSDGYVSHVH